MTPPRPTPPAGGPEPLVPPQHARTIRRVMGGTLAFHAVAAVVLWQVAQSTQTGAMGTDDAEPVQRLGRTAQPPEAVAAARAAGGSGTSAAAKAPPASRADWLSQTQRKDRPAPWGLDAAGNVIWQRK